MVLRGAGEVGCAHCKVIGADRSCQICTRMICEKCAGDWATCDQPSGRVVRLGASARVRDVDPTGKLALVSHWRQPLRLFDLRQLEWVEGIEIARRVYLWGREAPPRIASDGTLVYSEIDRLGGDFFFRGVQWRTFKPSASIVGDGEAPVRGTQISATRDRYWYITDTQRVVVMHREIDESAQPTIVQLAPLDRERIVTRTFEPLPRKVIQAAFVDAERDLLASASWSELVLHRMVDGRLDRLGHTKTNRDGDVVWLAVAGPWHVAAVRSGGVVSVELRRINDKDVLGSFGGALVPKGPFGTAALSRDGKHLAIATDDLLTVYDLDHGSAQTFTDHSERINFVRFASEDHVLISADTDHRVVLRPRTADGYATPLIPIEVP